MRVSGNDVLVDMPVRIGPVYQIFKSRTEGGYQYVDAKREAALRAKAERVAWRQLLRWVQAQNATIETDMVQAGEVLSVVSGVRRRCVVRMAIGD